MDKQLLDSSQAPPAKRIRRSYQNKAIDENQKPAWMQLQILTQHPVTQQDSITQKHVGQAAIVTDLKLSTSSQASPTQHRLSAIYSVESDPQHPPPLVAKSFAIVWDHTIEPDSLKPGLKCAMNRAKADGVHLPSELQELKKDPRQMHEESLLYRQIREQFECRALGIDLGKLLLQYNCSALGEGMLITQNLEDEAWSDTQAALADPGNERFIFRVGFFALKKE